MNAQPDNREANATIRGYLYQFDATISAILGLNSHDELLIEGIEDFDVERDERSELFQCKYYASQRLMPSTIRDAVLPMLKGFVSVDRPLGTERRYHLYGHFKDSTPHEKTLTKEELKGLLIRRERTKLPSGETETKVIDIRTEIGATDDDIELFVQRLKIHICAEYEAHKKSVVQALQGAFHVSQKEAEDYLYPSARTLVSELAAKPSRDARKISKQYFFQQVRPSIALYNAWTLREKSESAYCRGIKRSYFTAQNIDAAHRFFIVEVPAGATNEDLIVILRTLERKWSSHRIRRKPNDERYAPYIYFRFLSPERLVALKASLQQEGVRFVDGYAFLGSEFTVDHLCCPQTYENKISLRFVNSDQDLLKTLREIRGQIYIYDFFIDRGLHIDLAIPYVGIPITSVDMLTHMV